MTPLYRVAVTPVDDLWSIQVDGLPGRAMAVRRQDAERIARKFISLNTGAPADAVCMLLEPDVVSERRPHRGAPGPAASQAPSVPWRGVLRRRRVA